jgi:hypothetical protein
VVISLIASFSLMSTVLERINTVETCDRAHYSWLQDQKLADRETRAMSTHEWQLMTVMLGEKYNEKTCWAEAEQVFSQVISVTRDRVLMERAKAGLDRSLAARDPSQ